MRAVQMPIGNVATRKVSLLMRAGAFAGVNGVTVTKNKNADAFDIAADAPLCVEPIDRTNRDPAIGAIRRDRRVAHVHWR